MARCSFNLVRLRDSLKPFRLYWFARLRSTNDHAAAMRRDGRLFAPAAVLAGRQTAGRGRGSNRWHSAPGTLTVTFALPIEEHLSPQQLPLVAGLAVRSAAAELTREESIGLKWPNDIVHDGRKLAGLLCERIHRVDLIGVGLNVNNDPTQFPLALRRRVTSLQRVAGRELDMTDVLIAVARHLHRVLGRRNQYPLAALLQEYGRHHVLTGRRIRVTFTGPDAAVVGRCAGLDHLGRLLMEQADQTRRIASGHVELLG